MVSTSYEQAVRKLVPCDSLYSWDDRDESPHPNIDPTAEEDSQKD
jgi:hypothetical protein